MPAQVIDFTKEKQARALLAFMSKEEIQQEIIQKSNSLDNLHPVIAEEFQDHIAILRRALELWK